MIKAAKNPRRNTIFEKRFLDELAFLPKPAPSKAMPDIGSQAWNGPFPGNRSAVVVTRAVVFITSDRLCAPLLRLGIGLLVKLQVAPVGSPEHAKETVSGNPAPVGVTVTVYCAGTPAGTVVVAGVTATPKSFTVTEAALADVWKLEPGTVSLALFPNGGGCDGVVPWVV